MKTSADYLDEASSVVTNIGAVKGIERHHSGNTLFIDVRDSSEITETGTIANALRIPRGMIEFVADESTPFYNSELQKDRDICTVCALGGMAILAGKTLTEMGYRSVSTVGGIDGWIGNNGPMEP